MFNSFEAVVLAAGKGKRMRSQTPKVIHSLLSKPMVFYTLENLYNSGLKKIIVVVGFKASQVKKAINKVFGCRFAHQEKLLGTAHALSCALAKIDPKTKYLLVLNGDDSAFYKTRTLKKYLRSHLNTHAVMSMLTTFMDQTRVLGRVIRDGRGEFAQTLEHQDYVTFGKYSDEINCGAYIFNLNWLKSTINQVKVSNTGEYYINDLANIAKAQGERVNLFRLEDPSEWLGINTKEELEYANQKMHEKA